MPDVDPFFRWTELDRTTLPGWLAQVSEFDPAQQDSTPRSYPGYPSWPLPRCRARWWPSLDRALAARRCIRQLGKNVPRPRVLGRLLQFAHGVTHDGHGGPIPSSGGLQALELYLAILENDWLPAGAYHFDRQGHCLAQLASCTSRPQWLALVPSLCHVEGGSVLWVIVGDGARIRAKYGERGLRFLLLEAGHLMQDLCLLSASLELCTVPLGGFLEKDIGRVLTLPPADQVLYVGVCGEVSGR